MVSSRISRAAEHSRAFEKTHLAGDEPTELQLGEQHSFGAAREQRTWVYSALEVWSRLWLGS